MGYTVVIACDSFKGSLTATQACHAAAHAVRNRFGNEVTVIEVPMADGGEGSLDLLSDVLELESIGVDSVDAIGRPIRAEYLWDATGRLAYIEIARAAGLPQVSDVPLEPRAASSFGVGILIADALTRGATELNIFLGGSATTDAGSGIVTALGAVLMDEADNKLDSGGGSLEHLRRIDTTRLLAQAGSVKWHFITDVDATLTGENSAARRYAPQKGARDEDVAVLERGMRQLAKVLEEQHGFTQADRPGIGAAGAMAAIPTALFQASTTRGGMFFAHRLGLVDALNEADLVITGEGAYDVQSLDGKVVGTIAQLAAQRESRIPVVVIAGEVSHAPQGTETGVSAAFSLAEGVATREQLHRDAGALLARRAVQVVSLAMDARSRGGST